MFDVLSTIIVTKLKSGEELIGIGLEVSPEGFVVIGYPCLLGYQNYLEFFPYSSNRIFPLGLVDIYFYKEASYREREKYHEWIMTKYPTEVSTLQKTKDTNFPVSAISEVVH